MSISHTIFISIHAPAEGATAKAQNIAYCNNIFQSTLPRRERLATITTKDRFGLVFQSTLPRRERRVASPMPRHSSFQFQSTLPRRERPRTWKAVLLEVIFQSTLPWRERRYRCLNCCKSCCISIHAPAEGATQFMKQTGGDIGISIHAPAEGATNDLRHKTLLFFISIHAPAEGATMYLPFPLRSSQSRFQSTLPRRERLLSHDEFSPLQYFNPRSRGGSDRYALAVRPVSVVFQSTLPRRERLFMVSCPCRFL